MTATNGGGEGVKKVKKTKNQIRRERAKAKKAEKQLEVVVEGVNGRSDNDVAIESGRRDGIESLESNGSNKHDVGDDEKVLKSQVEDERANSHASRQLTDLTNIFDSEIDQYLNDPKFAQYKLIFNKFYTEEHAQEEYKGENEGQVFYSDDDGLPDLDSNSDNEKNSQLTKKKLKQLRKVPLALLKSHAKYPEIVEWYDADANDSDLLVQLKSSKGVIQVPDHWQLKREFLSTKRGVMRQPFELPSFIKATGIMDMRDALKDDDSTLKQKTRERVQPKMGKLDIDYQKLHDAFFKFQTKPRLFLMGDVYYEGKENELNTTKYRPGKLSQRLKKALNIPPGAPPPWLLNMQRYGPPPSYSGLRIAGLNSPIPSGAQWGFQPGGWGRAPVDNKGAPLYGGDLYGLVEGGRKDVNKLSIPIEKKLWGEMISDEEEEEEEDEEEEEEEEGDEEDAEDEGQGYVDEETAMAREIEEEREAAAAAAAESVAPDFELRKSKRSAKTLDEDDNNPTIVSDSPKQLFQVLEQTESDESGFMGKQQTYNMPTTRKRRRFEEQPSDVQRKQFEANLNDLLESEKSKINSNQK